MATEFIVDRYTMCAEHLNEKGETFARDLWENKAEFAITGRFPTIRAALDAILRRHTFPAELIDGMKWTALESVSGFGRKVTFYANFTTHTAGVTSNFGVRANVLKAVLSMPDAEDSKELNGKKAE